MIVPALLASIFAVDVLVASVVIVFNVVVVFVELPELVDTRILLSLELVLEEVPT